MTHRIHPHWAFFFAMMFLAGGSIALAEAPPTESPSADPAWRAAKNLVVDGSFDTVEQWTLIRAPKEGPAHVRLADALPRGGQAAIYRQPQGNGKTRNVLAMNLDSREVRRGRPICESAEIRVAPGLRYRFQLQYRTNRPAPLVIVRGYATVQDQEGKPFLKPIRQWRFSTEHPQFDQWETFSGEFSVERTKNPIRVVKIQLGGQGKNGGYLYYDDLEFKGIGRAPTTRASH